MATTDTLRIPPTDGVPPPEFAPVTALVSPTREEAERQGWWAYGFGEEPESNPYSAGTEAVHWWGVGWEDAASDDAG